MDRHERLPIRQVVNTAIGSRTGYMPAKTSGFSVSKAASPAPGAPRAQRRERTKVGTKSNRPPEGRRAKGTPQFVDETLLCESAEKAQRIFLDLVRSAPGLAASSSVKRVAVRNRSSSMAQTSVDIGKVRYRPLSAEYRSGLPYRVEDMAVRRAAARVQGWYSARTRWAGVRHLTPHRFWTMDYETSHSGAPRSEGTFPDPSTDWTYGFRALDLSASPRNDGV